MHWRKLPKIELHLHLDCSLSFQAVTRLKPEVTPEQYRREYTAPARCANLAEFLAVSRRGVELLQTEDALRLATEDLFAQLAEDGILYAEIRFAPLLHTAMGMSAARAVQTVEETTARLAKAGGIEAGLILCTLRHFSVAQSLETARLAQRFQGSRVTGLDLAGDEAGYAITNHIEAYRCAREHGIGRTAHAGEARGPESVWETIEKLEPQRIGHGTRSIEDPKLVEHLKRTGIHLELCPAANVQIIPEIGSLEKHPIDLLQRAGVRLNVNSDSRMLTPTTLTQEYESLERCFGWNREQFLASNLAAADAAFADEETKQRLKKILQNAYLQDLQAERIRI